MAQPNFTEFGIAGVVLIVLFWVMKFATTMTLAKKGAINGNGEIRELINMMKDLHKIYGHGGPRKQIEELHTMTADTEKMKNQGQFKCVWRGRDEVRDLMEILKRMAEATEALTVEMKWARNGRAPK